MNIVEVNGDRIGFAGGNLAGHTAADIGDFPFQIAKPGLAGVAGDDLFKSALAIFYLLGL